jgi:hypothetical protein
MDVASSLEVLYTVGSLRYSCYTCGEWANPQQRLRAHKEAHHELR